MIQRWFILLDRLHRHDLTFFLLMAGALVALTVWAHL